MKVFSLSLTIWSADNLLIIVNLQCGIWSISLESDHMVVPVIEPPFVVGDDDVFGAEVVGDGNDPVDQGQH